MNTNVLTVVVGVILLVALLAWQLFGNLDKIVAGVIEDTGSEVLKTKVSVAGVSIDLKGGQGRNFGYHHREPRRLFKRQCIRDERYRG